MTQPPSGPLSDDDSKPPIRARVPEGLQRGVFSTGVIVMTGATEFIIDFVQNLGRPHQIVARIVMPHPILPQFAEALKTNIDLYTQRYGPLPVVADSTTLVTGSLHGNAREVSPTPSSKPQVDLASGTIDVLGSTQSIPPTQGPSDPESPVTARPPASKPPSNLTRKMTAQEVYDDLKLPDELLSGAYANAVVIGHGPHEFSLDFITNFYPQFAVSSRVYLAAGQIHRLLDSLRSAWEQYRQRLQEPPKG
jgi:hypothetical protein